MRVTFEVQVSMIQLILYVAGQSKAEKRTAKYRKMARLTSG